MYSDGKQPFGAAPFPGLDAILTAHVTAGGNVLDLGAGYGRDAIFLAREHKCQVTAVDPAQEGMKALDAAAAKEGLSITAVCSFLEDYEFSADTYDMVLMDSVLSFLDPEIQPSIVNSAVQSLKPGGHLVIIGWPNEEEVGWVGRLVAGALMQTTLIKDAEVNVTHAVLDGKEMQMTWHVTVAKRG